MILDKIKKENDIKKLSKAEVALLPAEIRSFILDNVSRTGGHLASNLGTVELTMALHLCMNFPEDKLVFDVGHQSYTHKILTGRKEGFENLRGFGGMSGFPKMSESDSDAFGAGHSSTSISAAMGLVKARELRGSNERICAVIGDGSMTGGMFYEAIDQLSSFKSNLVIILNDNEMSISKNVGGMSKALTRMRVGESYNDLKHSVETAITNIPDVGPKMARRIKRQKDNIRNFFLPGMFVEELGLTYLGPVDGHNLEEMRSTFEKAFRLSHPILVHVKTVKGKGYPIAEKHPTHFHGVGPFDVETGKNLTRKTQATYTDVFSKALMEVGSADENVVAITAAMSRGTGVHEFKKNFPDRAVDVGIAEEHAVTFAAGLAAGGYTPVVAIYSSFLQRAYDQILHDVCLQKLHVVLAIDRSGIVPGDGVTHQGIYDTAYLSDMPGLTVIAPKNAQDLLEALRFAVSFDGPVAIKYAKGNAYRGLSKVNAPFEPGKAEVINSPEGCSITIMAVGNMVEEAVAVRDTLSEEYGAKPGLISVRFIKPLDTKALKKAAEESRVIVIMEEAVRCGSVGEMAEAHLYEKGIDTDVLHFCIQDEVLPCGSVSDLRASQGMSREQMAEKIAERAGLKRRID